MVDWVLPNAGVLIFLELTNASRDVCIIYMSPVRVLEQKHHVRRSFTLIKKNNNNNEYSKAVPDEMAFI